MKTIANKEIKATERFANVLVRLANEFNIPKEIIDELEDIATDIAVETLQEERQFNNDGEGYC